MSSLAVDKNITPVAKLNRESGEKTYPIWLVVNPKHPAVRRNIWTPILTTIQDKVFREMHARVDTTRIYLRNAVEDCETVPNNTLNWWGVKVAAEIEAFREMVLDYRPKLLISFGAFPYEFLRRVLGIKPEKGSRAWSNYNLEAEFRRALEDFDINKINIVPLLRRVMTNGKKGTEKDSCWKDNENYFCYAGAKLAESMIENRDSLDIWIK